MPASCLVHDEGRGQAGLPRQPLWPQPVVEVLRRRRGLLRPAERDAHARPARARRAGHPPRRERVGVVRAGFAVRGARAAGRGPGSDHAGPVRRPLRLGLRRRVAAGPSCEGCGQGRPGGRDDLQDGDRPARPDAAVDDGGAARAAYVARRPGPLRRAGAGPGRRRSRRPGARAGRQGEDLPLARRPPAGRRGPPAPPRVHHRGRLRGGLLLVHAPRRPRRAGAVPPEPRPPRGPSRAGERGRRTARRVVGRPHGREAPPTGLPVRRADRIRAGPAADDPRP